MLTPRHDEKCEDGFMLAPMEEPISMPAPTARRVFCMISPLVPSRAQQESAGERLLVDVASFFEEHGSLHLISRDGPANQRAAKRGKLPDHTSLPARALRLRDRAGRILMLTPVVTASELRDLPWISAADTVDLQWEENALLIPAIRRLNPRARIVVTLHDVLSQRFARQAAQHTHPLRRGAWLLRTAAARALEHLIVRQADHVVVLSEKDAALLPTQGRRAHVHVVPPAIPGRPRAERANATGIAPPTLLFVGYLARWENQDAVRWLGQDILPLVRRVAPETRMLVAGGGAPPSTQEELTSLGIEMLGFVDDLEPLYDMADAVVVPLRYGAGVKFKIVDALVRGVPVVTTPVGNEGIHPQGAAIVADEAPALAGAIAGLLEDPTAAEDHARSAAADVARQFGLDIFLARLQEVYQ